MGMSVLFCWFVYGVARCACLCWPVLFSWFVVFLCFASSYHWFVYKVTVLDCQTHPMT